MLPIYNSLLLYRKKGEDGYQSNLVGEQGKKPKIPSSSLNHKKSRKYNLAAGYILLWRYILSGSDEASRKTTYYWPPPPTK